MRKERPLFRALFHGRGFLTPNRESRLPPHVAFPAKSAGASPEPGPRDETRARPRSRARPRPRARARRHATASRDASRTEGRAALARGASIPPDDTSGILPTVRVVTVAIDQRRVNLTTAPSPFAKIFHSPGNPRKDGETTNINPGCPPHDANKPRLLRREISRTLPTLGCREAPDPTGCTPHIFFNPGSGAARRENVTPDTNI